MAHPRFDSPSPPVHRYELYADLLSGDAVTAGRRLGGLDARSAILVGRVLAALPAAPLRPWVATRYSQPCPGCGAPDCGSYDCASSAADDESDATTARDCGECRGSGAAMGGRACGGCDGRGVARGYGDDCDDCDDCDGAL